MPATAIGNGHTRAVRPATIGADSTAQPAPTHVSNCLIFHDPPGVFASVRDLNAEIRAFIDGWNHRSHLFVRTKTAKEVYAKANREKT